MLGRRTYLNFSPDWTFDRLHHSDGLLTPNVSESLIYLLFTYTSNKDLAVQISSQICREIPLDGDIRRLTSEKIKTSKKIKPVDIGLRAAPDAAPLPDAFEMRGKRQQTREDRRRLNLVRRL